MILDYGNTHFDDVNGEVWTDEPRPYSAFRGKWSPEDYEDYLEEYRRQHGYYDEEEEEADDDEESDSDAEDIS